MDRSVNMRDIKPANTPSVPDVFKEFRIGDRISVQWKEADSDRGLGKEGYKKEGVIVQITPNSIYYRCSSGYVCGVSINQIASGVQVKVRHRTVFAA